MALLLTRKALCQLVSLLVFSRFYSQITNLPVFKGQATVKVPTLPEPVKKKKSQKSYQTVVEKTDVMEKQKDKYPETNKIVVPPMTMNQKTGKDPEFVAGLAGTQSIPTQSNKNRTGSQSSLRSFTKQAENQSIVKPKTQSTNEQLEAANKMATIAAMKTEANQAIEERREKESVRQKQSKENIRSSRTSLTDAAGQRNAQSRGPVQALPKTSASQTPKKSKFCSLM